MKSKDSITLEDCEKTATRIEYQTLDNPKTTVNRYDDYNRLSSSSQGNNDITITYEDLLDTDISPIDARIKSITDPYDEVTYNYTYDDLNQSSEYTITKNSQVIERVKTLKDKSKFYNIDEDVLYIFGSDYSKLTSSKYLIKNNTNNTWSQPEKLTFEYSYDSFGRILKKEGTSLDEINPLSHSTSIYTDKEYSYKPETRGVCGISYHIHVDYSSQGSKDSVDSDEAIISYSCEYYDSLNINQVLESGNRYEAIPEKSNLLSKVELTNRTYNYTFDSFNHLTKEIDQNNNLEV